MTKQKMKTHSGAKKRFKVTATKKYLHSKGGRNHLRVKKGNNLDMFSHGKVIHESDYKTVKSLLPYSG